MNNHESEVIAKEKINHFYYEELEFCGCGSPHLILQVIKDLLDSIATRWNNVYENKECSLHLYDNMMNRNKVILGFNDEKITDNQCGVYYLILNVLDSKGLLEHGGSIGGSWLTDYGKEILSYLNMIDDLEDVLD